MQCSSKAFKGQSTQKIKITMSARYSTYCKTSANIRLHQLAHAQRELSETTKWI